MAYGLAHAVIDWHVAGTLEERVKLGIVVLWRPDNPNRREEEVTMQVDEDPFVKEMFDGHVESKGESTPGENSEDDSEDEQEKDRQAVLNALEPSAAFQEALDEIETARAGQVTSQEIQFKAEDVEDDSALRASNDDSQAEANAEAPDDSTEAEEKDKKASVLRPGATDVLLAEAAPEASTSASGSKPKAKAGTYAHLRESIVYSDVDQLFVDLDDLDLAKGMSELSTDDSAHFAPPSYAAISTIFPDLQPYGLLDVPPASASDGKKKERRGDRDDPTKRADDTTYNKAAPMSCFMLQKTTLLGPLEPAKHWRDGEWHSLEDTTVVADFDTPSARPIDDSVASCTCLSFVFGLLELITLICSALFEGSKQNSPSSLLALLPVAPTRRRTPLEIALMDGGRSTPAASGSRSRAPEHSWTAEDDVLLKKFADKYPLNWMLIADALNSSRVSISIDKRTPLECQERWKVRFGGAAPAEDDSRPPPTPTTQRTTRGTKRSLSTSVNSSGANGSGSSHGDSKKRRRHNLMHEAIRKAVKKREAAQKASGR